MTWLLRITERFAQWLKRRREAKARAHAAQLEAAKDAAMSLWNHLRSTKVLDPETEARFDKLFEVLTIRRLR